MEDPFDNPVIAKEMYEVLGSRYVCSACGWRGNYKPTTKVLHNLIDRWQQHAEEVQAIQNA